MQATWIQSLGWEDPLEKGRQPTPVFLPGESYGERNLAGYSPWGHKEWDVTDQDSFIHLGEKLLTVINRGIFSFEGFPCVPQDKNQSKQEYF